MIEKIHKTSYGDIHYWVNKSSHSGYTLVFLPGLTADHRLFDKQIEYFGSKYNIFVWDAPAHGASRPFSPEFSLEDEAKWLNEIMMNENIEAPVLIGQSMGGYVSQCYMEAFPSKAAGFVSIDSASLKRKYITSMELFALKHTEGMYRVYPWKALIRDGAQGCAVSEYGRKLMTDMICSYEKDEYCKLTGHGFRILAKAIEADLEYKITCPAILICGENDKAGFTKKYNKIWSENEGIKIHWIADAGHNSNTDRPDEVNKIIEGMLERIKRKNMDFQKITLEDDIEELSKFASEIVKEHFDPIIGSAQNDYMIKKFQSVAAITDQLEHGYNYYFVNDDMGKHIGFMAFYMRKDEMYLSKFYLKKACRGRGYAHKMLDFVIAEAVRAGVNAITLNVNRNNSAILAYEKMGFVKTREEVNDIGNGFVMDDYVYSYYIKEGKECTEYL